MREQLVGSPLNISFYRQNRLGLRPSVVSCIICSLHSVDAHNLKAGSKPLRTSFLYKAESYLLAEASAILGSTYAVRFDELFNTLAQRRGIEQLERDTKAPLDHYAAIAPEALDSLTPEGHNQLYKMLRLEVLSVLTLSLRSNSAGS